MTTTDPLTQLRDIHVPTLMNWNWLGLISIILIISFIAGWLIIYYRRKTLFRREALQALNKIEQQFQQDQNTQKLVMGCNQLLRRLCLTLYPAEQVAGLTGESWLDFLNQHNNKNIFNPIERKLLTEEMYQQEIAIVDSQEFIQHMRYWIRQARILRTLSSMPRHALSRGRRMTKAQHKEKN